MAHAVTLIPGDGIGPEVVRAARRVLEATGVAFVWDVQDIGAAAWQRTGEPLPRRALDSIRERGVALKGPVATPAGHGFRSVNIALRDALGLYAGVRPCRTWPGAPAPLGEVGVVVIRMTRGDLYAGLEFPAGSDGAARLRALLPEASAGEVPEDAGISLKPVSAAEARRVARFALRWAGAHARRRVTVVHKATVMRATDGLFLAAAREVAAERGAGGVPLDDRLVDSVCHDLVAGRAGFDVLLCTMLYGDLLSDLCAGLTGGLGLAPGVNVGDDCAVFEAVHGTAERHAGRDRANPIALILSGAMLLRHLGESDAADRVEAAVGAVIARGAVLTYDLARGRGRAPAGTAAVADAVIAELQRPAGGD